MTTRKQGLRAALRKRAARTTVYRMPLVEFPIIVEKQNAVAAASQTLMAGEALRYREGDREDILAAIEKANAAHEKAKADLEQCFHQIVFRGMPEDEFDLMVAAYDPTEKELDEAKAKGEEQPMFGRRIYPHLLERCAQDSELSAAEWAEELAGWEKGDRREVEAKVLEANVRSFATALSFV